MKKRLLPVILLAITMILMLLPYGAVCIFMEPNGPGIRETYSYFSLIPYGYANFGPFLTACLSVLGLINALLYAIFNRQIFQRIFTVLCIIAFLTSLFPVFFFGVKYLNLFSILISSLLLVVIVLEFLWKQKK